MARMRSIASCGANYNSNVHNDHARSKCQPIPIGWQGPSCSCSSAACPRLEPTESYPFPLATMNMEASPRLEVKRSAFKFSNENVVTVQDLRQWTTPRTNTPDQPQRTTTTVQMTTPDSPVRLQQAHPRTTTPIAAVRRLHVTRRTLKTDHQKIVIAGKA